jgi:diguanylate cyclase (GGDEF)-like protein
MRKEKIRRRAEFKKAVAQGDQKKIEEARRAIDELARIQQADITMGATHIGAGDNIESVLDRTEPQNKKMKAVAAALHGRDPAKYQSNLMPNEIPKPTKMAEIEKPEALPFGVRMRTAWQKLLGRHGEVNVASEDLGRLRPMQYLNPKTVKRDGGVQLTRYTTELGEEIHIGRIYKSNPSTGAREFAEHEIPLRDGMLDGSTSFSRDILNRTFTANPNNELMMVKLKSLKYGNYFRGGMQTGDAMLASVARAIKRVVREQDLGLKLRGNEFVINYKGMNKADVAKAQDRIRRIVNTDPVIQKILADENALLNSRILEAQSKGQVAELAQLQQQKKELYHFREQRLELDFESINVQEVPPFEPGLQEDTATRALRELDKRFKARSN